MIVRPKVFNDGDTEQVQAHWASVRLGHIYEVGHRIRQVGATNVTVIPEHLAVTFLDPLIKSRVRLEIEPWDNGDTGWYWWCHVDLPTGFSMGALPRGRRILHCPYPREVVRAYMAETWLERLPVPRKHPGRKGRS